MIEMEKTVYSLYDSRANEDIDSAICYSVCETLAEAMREKESDFPDAVIFKETGTFDGKTFTVLTDEQIF